MVLITITSVIVGLALVLLETALRSADRPTSSPTPLGRSQTSEPNESSHERDFAALNSYAASHAKSSREWRDVRLSFRSPTINMIDGWRCTTDQPSSAHRALYLYGGSTVLCIEVPDKETLASHLQRHIATIDPTIAVQNRGISGATVAGSVRSMDVGELGPLDLVVAYFGVNDAKLNTYIQRGRGPFRFVPFWVAVLGLLRIRLRLRIAEWLWLETVILDIQRQTRLSQERAVLVRSTLEAMQHEVARHGARFLAVLQPHIWLKPASAVEHSLRARMASTTPTLLTHQYNAYRREMDGLPWFIDLSLSMVDTADTLFCDWAHTNADGNAWLAARLLTNLSVILESD